jgi:hypothetical protein
MKEKGHNTSSSTVQNIMTRIQRRRPHNGHHRPGGSRSSWLTTCALMSLVVGFAVYNIRYFNKRKARLKELGQLPYQQQELQLRQQSQSHNLKRVKWVTESAQPFVSSVPSWCVSLLIYQYCVACPYSF